MVSGLFLSRLEESMIEGEHGEAVQYAMRLLVKYGDVFEAANMVPIRHAHISCTFSSIEGPFLDWFLRTPQHHVI